MNVNTGLFEFFCSISAMLLGPTATCCGCGVQHRERNESDNSFKAFCCDGCYDITMEEIAFQTDAVNRDHGGAA